MTLRDKKVVTKIGVTQRKWVHTRLGEILLGFFTAYGYIPHTEVRKSGTCANEFGAEAELHRRYKKVNYWFDKEFTGSTEFFVINDYADLTRQYAEVLYEFREEGPSANSVELDDINETLASLAL